jgi:hypothetical protein
MAAATFRESSAGQIARLFFGAHIAPYEDEKEGFDYRQCLPQHPAKSSAQQSTAVQSRDDSPSGEEEADLEKDHEKEDPEKDIERDGEEQVAGAHGPGLQCKSHADNPNIVGWIGDNDQDNPQNWSSWKKLFTYAQICLLTFSSEYSHRTSRCAQLTRDSLQCFCHRDARGADLHQALRHQSGSFSSRAVDVCFGIWSRSTPFLTYE